MNTWLWIGQILLAVIFGAAGLMKLRTSRDELRQRFDWIDDVPSWVPGVAGVAEVAGAIGVILPGLLDIAPVLVPIAAGSLGVVMLLAMWVQIRRPEPIPPVVVVNFLLFVLAFLVTWGRIEELPL